MNADLLQNSKINIWHIVISLHLIIKQMFISICITNCVQWSRANVSTWSVSSVAPSRTCRPGFLRSLSGHKSDYYWSGRSFQSFLFYTDRLLYWLIHRWLLPHTHNLTSLPLSSRAHNSFMVTQIAQRSTYLFVKWLQENEEGFMYIIDHWIIR